MRALLFDHPLLRPYAESVIVALDWAAERARASGLSADEAADRLKWIMESIELAEGEHPAPENEAPT